MFIFSLILLQVFVFGALVFFLKHLLTRNVTSATSHLQGMIKDHTSKQEEIKKKLEEAQKRYDEAIIKAKKETEDLKEKYRKEIEEERDGVIEKAHQESEEIVKRAHKTSETVRAEIEKIVNEKAQEKAAELICQVLPKEVAQLMHTVWIKSLINEGISGLDRLRVPEAITKAQVQTAFSLSKEEKGELTKRLKEKLDTDIEIEESIQANLVSGMVISLGNVVFDGSFASKIREVARELTEK